MQKTLKRYFPIFVLPTLIAFSFAFIIPFVMGVYLSFCKFKTITNAQFVGLENYIKIFADKDFVNAFGFTLKFSVVSIVTINVFAFILALALTRKIKGTNLFRTVFFMPNLIGGIILGYIWQQMINAVLLKYETTLVANPTYGLGSDHSDELADDRLYDDHLCSRTAECTYGSDRSSRDRWSYFVTDIIQSENSDGYAIYYHMFVPHRVQQL